MSFGQGNCSLKTAFGFSFAHRLVAASSGSFDETGHEQLVVGTETGKICLQGSESIFHVNDRINFLSVYKRNKKTKEQSTKSSDNSDYDIVIIGTNVGNVDEYKNENVIICGCGTTIWGFSLDGKDLFWTALGDQINVLELCDMDGDGLNEVLKKASFFAEFDEGDPTLALTAIKPATFAFGLSSGVVGVYGQGERLWRVKTKSRIVSLLSFPDQGHVACVWQNAKIDLRSVSTGEIRTKDQLEGCELSIAFLVDLAGVGPLDSGEEQPQLTLVFKNGQGI
uniref:BBS2_Mid domain-containing protein n=1 Tax=Meloidogyne hapla TaxID=6305 RepID=A0A1I8B3Z3_MELHA